MTALHVCELTAPFGPVTVAATEVGVVGVFFGALPDAVAEIERDLGACEVVTDGDYAMAAAQQLREYFAGERDRFDVPLDLCRVRGDFRAKVLRELATSDFGETMSYGELAARVGNPGASRAVGSAMRNNPIAVIIPCHRVIRSGGHLGGFAGQRDGNDTKRWLLAREGVHFFA